jgi:hypothetical protein
MNEAQAKALLAVTEQGMRAAKAGYYAGTAGMTYEFMRAAAARHLSMKVTVEKALYGRARTRVTPRAISDALR